MPIEIAVPDIGDFKDVAVIEVHVKPGMRVAGQQRGSDGRINTKFLGKPGISAIHRSKWEE